MDGMIRPLTAREKQAGVQPAPGRRLGHTAAQGFSREMVRAG